MRLSIIVPVYNMAADNKLRFCMDSLINQTLPKEDYEILAVDDASTDESLEILKEYEGRFPGLVRVIASSENHRQGGAKNRGLDVCKGEYIGFVDSDDFVKPQMYEKLLNKAVSEKADIVACNLYRTHQQSFEPTEVIKGIDPEAVGEMTEEHFSRFIMDTGHMVIKIYARHIFEEPRLRFPEHMFYEDNAIALETIHRAVRTAYVDEAMYYYYQHAGSTVHGISTQRCRDRMEAARKMLSLAKEGNYLEPYKEQLEYKFVNLFYQNTLFTYMQGKQRKQYGFLKDMAAEMRMQFPEFEHNRLYLTRVNAEERKLMHFHQKSVLFFLLYYKLLWTYRRFRYGSEIQTKEI